MQKLSFSERISLKNSFSTEDGCEIDFAHICEEIDEQKKISSKEEEIEHIKFMMEDFKHIFKIDKSPDNICAFSEVAEILIDNILSKEISDYYMLNCYYEFLHDGGDKDLKFSDFCKYFPDGDYNSDESEDSDESDESNDF